MYCNRQINSYDFNLAYREGGKYITERGRVVRSNASKPFVELSGLRMIFRIRADSRLTSEGIIYATRFAILMMCF